ncbi:hypothetical protein BGZ93_000353 [Podila epicladia]|nr:hypothetical protein BGZ92_001679 [Podila epicladia]KAG0085966.1 hypothetical protein BGZ93_000353 [Podila epicladia]
MIVDHLLTRTGVRSLGLLLAGIVPLAGSYVLYSVAYKETPVDTVINQIPALLQLLQSNTSAADLCISSSHSIPTDTNSTVIASSLNASIPHTITKSPIVATFLAIVQYIDRHGYRDPGNIPGYQYLQPYKEMIDPFLAFISSHRTIAWIVTLFHLWMLAELLFFIKFWKKLARLQEVDRVVKGVGARSKRSELFQRCLETVEDGEGVKRWIEIWFDTGRTKQPAKFEDIGRENMIHWLAWAFWAAPVEEVLKSPAAIIELNQMVDTIETTKNVKFIAGFNPNVDCIRLNLDPVIASHRPLIYYSLVWIANTLTGFVFNLLGFTRYDRTIDQTTDFEKDELASLDVAHWHRTPANPENKIPLVFIHGIGVGLVQYIHLVAALTTISRPLILIEVPYVSNRLVHTDCLTPDQSYFAIERILKMHGHTSATFMGHSLGTMLCAAICRASPASSAKSIVAGLILADPICFLTHHSIARNFAYRSPSTASQLVMDLFAAREIGTSWYIMRRFCWNQCVMFPIAWSRRRQSMLPLQGKLSPVLPKNTRVFLSRNDNLLDMDKVEKYLKRQVGLVNKNDELVVMDGMDHAQFLLRPEWFSKVLKAAREC